MRASIDRARRHAEEPGRGYAGGPSRLLRDLARGVDWREAAPALFEGGSCGNGLAMPIAPLGAGGAAPPAEWVSRREPLPADLFA